MMRVISGKARGRKLKLVPGDTTRPIMDRVKENLFNILGQDVRGSRWLDLFAGTGAVGIEALSRGASSALFTDNGRRAIETIRHNLQATQLSEDGSVFKTDAFRFLENGRIPAPFDFIYVAPPQYKGLWEQAVTLIDGKLNELLADDGVVIVQIDPKEFTAVLLQNLSLADRRQYGNTQLDFYEREN